jgi:hypothetical protein
MVVRIEMSLALLRCEGTLIAIEGTLFGIGRRRMSCGLSNRRRAEPERRQGGASRPSSRRSGLAKLGVKTDIGERVLNHARERIEATYDVHGYIDEKREALEKWAKYFSELRDGRV